MWQNIPLWPERASSYANNVDALYIFLIAVTGFFTLLVFALVAFFALKYRQRPGREATQIEGSLALEATWTLIPFGLFMIMFVWGASVYMNEAQPPKNAMDVFVVGKQWMWKLQHPEGVREINQLHVPVGRDVRLTMISQDVIHSFFVPAFRIKTDVLPGRYTTLWFHPIKTGTFHLFCAEYCGTNHSAMIGQIIVMEPAEYAAWLAKGSNEGSMAINGQQLFSELGCGTCHRSDTQGRGPDLAGIYGKPVMLDSGSTVMADDNYIRESILNPGSKVTAGFKPIMPTFSGLVSEEQLLSLISYVKSLGQPGSQAGTSTAAVSGKPAAGNAASTAGNAKVQ
jgi:cytochrome c oxidase subunit II